LSCTTSSYSSTASRSPCRVADDESKHKEDSATQLVRGSAVLGSWRV
jgi:hypothetical protein